MKNLKAFLLAAGLSGAAITGGLFIADHEGRVLSTYVDPVGITTECFGQRADGIAPGIARSEDYCLNQLARNLHLFNRQLLRLTDGVELTEGEHAAYLSFTYNVGAQAFADSTLRKKVLAGDRVGACNELSRWVYAKGVKLQGLEKRRAAERTMCLRDLTGDNDVFSP